MKCRLSEHCKSSKGFKIEIWFILVQNRDIESYIIRIEGCDNFFFTPPRPEIILKVWNYLSYISIWTKLNYCGWIEHLFVEILGTQRHVVRHISMLILEQKKNCCFKCGDLIPLLKNNSNKLWEIYRIKVKKSLYA